MKKAFFIVGLTILSLICFPFYDYAADDVNQEVIKLYLGEIKMVPVSNPLRVAVGNPNIADVVSATKNELTLSPKAMGTTTLVFWDNFGEQSYQVKVFAENIQEVKRRIDSLLKKLVLPGVSTQAEEDEGKVFLLGSVKTAQDKEKISLVLGPLMSKVVDLLVIKEEEVAIEIDVQVMELDKDATSTLGFSSPGTVTLTEVGSAALTAGGAPLASVFRAHNFTRSAFSWTLDALINEGKAKILSRPRLACQSGKEAELLVGGEKPIFTTEVASAGGEGTSVEYKEYGIKLKIKPTVTDENRIKVGLNVEISEIGVADSIGSATVTTAKAYPLTRRNVSTELYLNDEQTLSIGGLIKQKEEEDIRRTPFLSDIPLVGLFFRKKTNLSGGGTGERGNTELYITLTPKIVRSTVKDSAMDKTEKDKKSSLESAVATAKAEETLPADPLKNYANIIQKRILDNLRYPVSAKESSFQGTVKLSLHLSYLGQIQDVVVKTSSGYKILDDNAVEVARGLISYPPFPPSIAEKDLWIDIPIEYRLN